jgi:hypothetical protein
MTLIRTENKTMSLRYHVQNNVANKGWVTTAAFMAMANAVHWAQMDSGGGYGVRLLDNKTGAQVDFTDRAMEREAESRMDEGEGLDLESA